MWVSSSWSEYFWGWTERKRCITLWFDPCMIPQPATWNIIFMLPSAWGWFLSMHFFLMRASNFFSLPVQRSPFLDRQWNKNFSIWSNLNFRTSGIFSVEYGLLAIHSSNIHFQVTYPRLFLFSRTPIFWLIDLHGRTSDERSHLLNILAKWL